MSTKRENGVALITALMVLFLISAIIAGMAWMVMTDQRLGGNNANREVAFYGAEAGMEKMTADLGNIFTEYGSLTASNVTTIVGSAPTIPGVSYVNSQGQSTYAISYPGQPGNPTATTGTVLAPSPYAGLNALVTNYTLTVTAEDTISSGEVKLQRIVQTSDIPVFQFGIFSNVDLGFHAGDDFIFGGRVHTNGNLWLAAGSGDWLELPSKVTTAKEIVTSTVMNGMASSSGWSGAVDISNGSSYVNLDTQTPPQSISGTSWDVQTLAAAEANSTYTYNTNFSALASGTYGGNIGVKETGVTPLNLSIVTSSLGGQAIDLIRMPVSGEQNSAPAKLGLRYYSLASMRILLADYGPSGTCSDSDISPGSANPLPYISANSADPTMTAAPPYKAPPAWLTGANVYPLPLSAATGTTYPTSANGYWVRQYQPVIIGCIKIDYQSQTSPDSFTDVT
ncbi:MAG: pilus assembly PilX N-terminal domain-containing protein, partial [Candidatus Acidiferrales bacterium]